MNGISNYLEGSDYMKYRVFAKMVSYCYVDIEAESKEEAEMVAEDIDGGEFEIPSDGSWEICPEMTREVK